MPRVDLFSLMESNVSFTICQITLQIFYFKFLEKFLHSAGQSFPNFVDLSSQTRESILYLLLQMSQEMDLSIHCWFWSFFSIRYIHILAPLMIQISGYKRGYNMICLITVRFNQVFLIFLLLLIIFHPFFFLLRIKFFLQLLLISCCFPKLFK
jgi:hypothetical protein